MARRIPLAAALALLLATAPAWAEGAHQHGVARMEVVADGSSLAIMLDSPLDNLLAFERGPRTEAERSAVRAMAQRLHAAATLLQPTPAAGCTLRTVALQSDVIDPALLAKGATAAARTGTPAATPATTPAAGGHGDLEASFSFDCSQPQALKSLALGGLFQAFPRLRQLDVALAAPGVQRGARLTPQKPALAW